MKEGTGFAINYASDEVQSGINNSDFSLGEKTGLWIRFLGQKDYVE